MPPRPQVVGRFVFYNKSNFDGQNGSSNIVDGFAMATDKQALLPGQTATFQNYTSYSNGMNGIMIDVANFEGSITPDDYTILVGNSSDLSTWQPAPTPTFVTLYPGVGVGGSIRLELVWDNNAIQNEWVQVTLKANENTALRRTTCSTSATPSAIPAIRQRMQSSMRPMQLALTTTILPQRRLPISTTSTATRWLMRPTK